MAGHTGPHDAIISTSRFLVPANGGPVTPSVSPAWLSDHPTCLPNIAMELTARIGLPILFCLYTPSTSSATAAQAELEEKIIDVQSNPILNRFSIHKSPNGGLRTREVSATPRPNVLLARADRKQLAVGHVRGLWAFIDETKRRMPSDEAFLAEMTPEKFVKYWEGHPLYKWCKAGCPVTVPSAGPDPSSFVMSTSQKYRATSSRGIHLPVLYPSALSVDSLELQDFPLQITAHLGLPLLFSFGAVTPDQDTTEEDAGVFDTPDNPILRLLTISRAPTGYAQRRQHNKLARPVILLRRADGKELIVEHVMMMWIFINEETGKMRGPTHLDVSHLVDYDKFIAKMTPEKFIERWENDGGASVPYSACPVKLGCKSCGKMDEAPLLRCAKCGMVEYCGKECQEVDWALHKTMCCKWSLPRGYSGVLSRAWGKVSSGV
jgi:hypothetical protein